MTGRSRRPFIIIGFKGGRKVRHVLDCATTHNGVPLDPSGREMDAKEVEAATIAHLGALTATASWR